MESDAELLARLSRTGSHDAFAQIVRRHVDLVYSSALRRVRNPQMAEDVTQAVFLALMQKSPHLLAGTVLAGWLYQTSRYLSADVLKMERRRKHHERKAASQPLAEPIADQTWIGISPMLESAMDRLSELDRDVILLRFFIGMEVAAVAEATGIPANTASRRIGRALEKLRRFLAGRGMSAPADVVGAAISTGAIHPAPAHLATIAAKTAGTSPAIAALARSAAWRVPIAVKAAIILSLAAAWIIGGLYWFDPATLAPWRKAVPAQQAASTAPMLAGPLEPVSAQQAQQIRAAVYSLAHSMVLVQPNQWPAAMRTLIQIGPPAVPELVAELDRTQRDQARRALGFALRAIGDPRACPALIRALARTPPMSGGYLIIIDDPDLLAFLSQYQLGHSTDPRDAGYLNYGRSISEIAGALEKITGHVEGQLDSIDAENSDPQSLAAARERHRLFTDQWQQWWDQHSSEFVDAADIATLTAHPHDQADVRAAGVAEYGPIFPTGPVFHLGREQDVLLHLGNGIAIDQSEIIDFDCQRIMTLLEATRVLPTEPPKNSMIWPWHLSGADAEVERMSIPLKPNADPENYSDFRFVFGLQAMDAAVWQVDDRRWESLAGEIAEGKTVIPDNPDHEPGQEFRYHDPKTGNPDLDHFPVTFLFRTREGGAGILQLLGSDPAERAVRFRYRMVEPHAGHFVPLPFCAIPPSPPFGSAHQVTLNRMDIGGNCAFSFASGPLAVDPHTIPVDAPVIEVNWARQHKADLIPSGLGNKRAPLGLRLLDVRFVPLSDQAFDSLNPGLAQLALDRVGGDNAESLLTKDLTASTAAFRTHGGVVGIIQQTQVSNNPPSVTFRYKLLPPATQPTTQPARRDHCEFHQP